MRDVRQPLVRSWQDNNSAFQLASEACPHDEAVPATKAFRIALASPQKAGALLAGAVISFFLHHAVLGQERTRSAYDFTRRQEMRVALVRRSFDEAAEALRAINLLFHRILSLCVRTDVLPLRRRGRARRTANWSSVRSNPARSWPAAWFPWSSRKGGWAS